ncbi:anaerobic ribonucleoside-triphosphate reductase activating protein [Flavobacterium sp. KB82]|uniref:Anaerobic ribonucleoside-triphosphate reductase activating protein n=1 Tax=Flavobacterium hungaricum TaxID=2082725 RepID=A0ABR9TG65_9FLAO|nr:anaerobic ribonucleoside-triphosphate reductase activating protein [Flavobacterium hungaricum]
MSASNAVYSITPFTLLDYPKKTACIIWFAGCNMRCLYCYNPDIVLGKGTIDFKTAISFLESRIGLLDAVVLSGGECTIHKNIIPFIKKIKSMGFLVKIDTNGSNPLVVKDLIFDRLVDYIALDFKSLPETFSQITQSRFFSKFEQSLSVLMHSKIDFEIRTTFHSSLISETQFVKMIEFLESQNYEGKYYVQFFVNNVPTLCQLESSHKEIRIKNYSTSKIKVIFRD